MRKYAYQVTVDIPSDIDVTIAEEASVAKPATKHSAKLTPPKPLHFMSTEEIIAFLNETNGN